MNKITVETTRVNVGILQQLMHLNAKFIMTIVMVSALIFFEPWITIFGLVLISSVYLALYKFSHLIYFKVETNLSNNHFHSRDVLCLLLIVCKAFFFFNKRVGFDWKSK